MTRKALLMVSNGEYCHKQNLTSDKTVTIGNTFDDAITITDLQEQIEVKWQGDTWIAGNTVLQLNQVVYKEAQNQKRLAFFLAEDLETQNFDVTTKQSITFGAGIENDVILEGTKADFVLLRDAKEDIFVLYVYEGDVYHNFSLLTDSIPLHPGDQLYTEGIIIQVGKEDLTISAAKNRVTSNLALLFGTGNSFSEDYPDYHRSPRIIYRAPEDKVVIAKPSNPPMKPTEGIMRLILPPLVMMGVTLLIFVFQSTGMYMMMSLAMTVTTILISLTAYIKNRKQYKIDIKEREESYELYLKNKAKELYETSEKQRHSLTYHYPSIPEIEEMAQRVESRIYEKTILHHDFLTFRVGTGKEKSSFSIDFKEEEFTQQKDSLVEEARALNEQYAEVDNVPIATDLMHGPVGYIGPRRLVIEQLQMLVMQTAFFHSYYDLQFITIFPEEEKKDWNWMRWLPHGNLRDVNVRSFVYHERSRDQVLNSLYQILKERKQAVTEQSNKTEKQYFSPHYVVLITDEKLILDHIVMEFFNEDPRELGVSLVFVEDVMQSLPEHVKTVIDIRDGKSGNIILEQGELVNRAFVLDHLPTGFDKETISRALAPLNHLQNLKNSIPEAVTFLKMYQVGRVEELNISARWAKNEAYKSLAVPLGLRGKEDVVQLNLHEKAHGPHGLVAGTTGSGKSEIIQSYILSLAVNFHPYEAAFLLIDYKGGGMANLFKNMPHLLGTITNLDGAQSMRALASIKAELEKRQRLFNEHEVNHINQYQKLYKQGEATEPMPHLFLISDEFAELKTEQPDFMKELVSTARIGRSLGIHLILATQKPSGIVDDQIWSNSKFKVALKVQNTSDSNEILKTPDAADITLPGRAYLQVGNNEVYELFQSAWSGADYRPDKEEADYLDTTIYAINELGQYDILTEDLSGLQKKTDVTKRPTELEAVVDYIQDYAEEQGIKPLPRPWLPPLPERIFAQDLHPVDFEEAWKEPKKPLRATIALLDQPELQAQTPLTLDLTKDGHIAVFSSPGYGKSTFLQSVVMDLARQHNPEQLHVYLLDFGTNGLLPLADLPHVADTIMIDEIEKAQKFIRRLKEEMKNRKKSLSQYRVANLEQYENASGEVVPDILLVLDNYDSIREEEAFVNTLEPLIVQIAREGIGIGIHLLISGVRQTALKVQLLANIKMQIALYLIDQTDKNAIVGRTDLTIEEIPGQGLVKIEEPTLFQGVLPNVGENALEIIEANQKETKEMRINWKGNLPKPIPMVAEDFSITEFFEMEKTKQHIDTYGELPIGIDYEFVQPVAISLYRQNVIVSSGSTSEVASSLVPIVKTLARKSDVETTVIDQKTMGFIQARTLVNNYLVDVEEIEEFIEEIFDEFKAREEAYLRMVQASDIPQNPIDFYQQYAPKCIVCNGLIQIYDTLSSRAQAQLLEMLQQDGKAGIWFIIGNEANVISKSYGDLTNKIRESKLVILSMRITDQSVFNSIHRITQEKPLSKGEAYIIYNGQPQKVKVGM